MKRLIIAALASGLLTLPAFAQELRSEAEASLRSAEINLEIPEDATDAQLLQVIALTSERGHSGRSLEGRTQLEFEIKKALGME